MIFSLKTHLVDGAKHEWRDGEKTLEAQLPDIISLILLAGPILKERRRQHEEAERKRREEERAAMRKQERRKTDQTSGGVLSRSPSTGATWRSRGSS